MDFVVFVLIREHGNLFRIMSIINVKKDFLTVDLQQGTERHLLRQCRALQALFVRNYL